MFEVEIRHEGLNKYRHIRGSDRDIVRQKAQVQLNAWEEMWEKELQKRAAEKRRKNEVQRKQRRAEEAKERTHEAMALVEGIRDTLKHTLPIDDAIDWEAIKSREPFTDPVPVAPELPHFPKKPNPENKFYRPQLGILGHVIPFVRRRRKARARKNFEADLQSWQAEMETLNSQYEKDLKQNEQANQAYERRKREYEENQKKTNQAIDDHRNRYLLLDPGAILDYCELVLNNSKYPEFINKEFDIDFNGETKILVIDYTLPAPSEFPTLKEATYIQSRD